MLNRRSSRRLFPLAWSRPNASRSPRPQDFVGRVEAVQRVEVKARITGYLEKVAFKEGDLIKEGAPLYGIEKGLFEAAVEQAEGALDEEQGRQGTDRSSAAARRRAAGEGLRDRRLPATRRSPPINRRKARFSIDEANLQTAKINLGYAEHHLADHRQGRQDQYHQRQRRHSAKRAAHRHRQPGPDVCDLSGEPARIPARPAGRPQRRRHRHQGGAAVCRRQRLQAPGQDQLRRRHRRSRHRHGAGARHVSRIRILR